MKRRREPPRPSHDRVQLVVVCFLGAIGLVLSMGAIWLTFLGKTIDGGLFGIAGTAIGSLGTLLTTQRGTNQRASDDPMTIKAEEPLPVTNVENEQQQ